MPRPVAKAGRPAPPEPIGLLTDAVVEFEGQWSPVGTPIDGAPAMYRTLFRSDFSGRTIAGIVWIDQKAARAQLFAGAGQPAGQWTGGSAVPDEQRPQLLAAFNGGFRLVESQGGFYLDGTEAVPLRNGAATAHIDGDGTMTVGMLGRDFTVGPWTAAVRQNLPLLVDDGVVAASANDTDISVWGATLGQTPYVWRSGLGVRADGSLVYVGGPSMTSRMLGNVLVAAGAVRAMQLDINPSWVTYNIFRFDPASGQLDAERLLPNMTQPATRYLSSDSRDFFALFARA